MKSKTRGLAGKTRLYGRSWTELYSPVCGNAMICCRKGRKRIFLTVYLISHCVIGVWWNEKKNTHCLSSLHTVIARNPHFYMTVTFDLSVNQGSVCSFPIPNHDHEIECNGRKCIC